MSMDEGLYKEVQRLASLLRRLRQKNERRFAQLNKLGDRFGESNSDMSTSEELQRERAFITQLLDRNDASLENDVAEIRQLRRSCGSWIATQQLRLDISNDDIADRIGIDRNTIKLLQLGMADGLLATDEQWCRLAALLIDNEHDYEYVEYVVYLALGKQNFSDEKLMETIEQDLGLKHVLFSYDVFDDDGSLDSNPSWEVPGFCVRALIDGRIEETLRVYQEAIQQRIGTLLMHDEQTEYFVGRKQEQITLINALSQPNNHTIMLTGLAGVGKSTLAWRLVNEIGPTFPGGVLWVDATRRKIEPTRSTLGAFPWELFYDRDQTVASNHVNATAQLCLRLQQVIARSAKLLLIIDQFDEVIDRLEAWLPPATSQHCVLITARKRPTTPIPNVQEFELAGFNSAESVAFLCMYSSPPAVDNAATLYSISEALGHLPLALRLVGGVLQRYQEKLAKDVSNIPEPIHQIEKFDYLVARNNIDALDENLLKAFCVSYGYLEHGNAIDKLSFKLLRYIGNADNEVTPDNVTSYLPYALRAPIDTTAIKASLLGLYRIGILERDFHGGADAFRLRGSLRSIIGYLNRQWQNELLGAIDGNDQYLPLSSIHIPRHEDAQRIIADRFVLREILSSSRLSNTYDAIDRETLAEVIVKEGHVKCHEDNHSIICLYFIQLSSTLKWLSRRNFAAPRYCSLLHTDGKPYLVMTKITGRSFLAKLSDGSLKVRKRIQVFLDLCSQVHKLHQAGMVHGDLNGENILLLSDDKPVLIGWGRAQFAKTLDTISRAAAHTARSTRYHVRELSPAPYNDDIVALGAILQILIPRPSPQVAAIIRRATEQHADRYTTVAELQHELEAIDVGKSD